MFIIPSLLIESSGTSGLMIAYRGIPVKEFVVKPSNFGPIPFCCCSSSFPVWPLRKEKGKFWVDLFWCLEEKKTTPLSQVAVLVFVKAWFFVFLSLIMK